MDLTSIFKGLNLGIGKKQGQAPLNVPTPQAEPLPMLDGVDMTGGELPASAPLTPVKLMPWRNAQTPEGKLSGKLQSATMEFRRQKDLDEAGNLEQEYNALRSQIPDLDKQIKESLERLGTLPVPQAQAPVAGDSDMIAAAIMMLTGRGSRAIGNLGEAAQQNEARRYQNAVNQYGADQKRIGLQLGYQQDTRQELKRDAEQVRGKADDIYDLWKRMDIQKEQQGIQRTQQIEDDDRSAFNKIVTQLRLAETKDDAEAMIGMLKDIASRVPGLSIPAGLEASSIAGATKREKEREAKAVDADVRAFNASIKATASSWGSLTDEQRQVYQREYEDLKARGGKGMTPLPAKGAKTVGQQNADTSRSRANTAANKVSGGGKSNGGGKGSPATLDGEIGGGEKPMNPFGQAANIETPDRPYKATPTNALYGRRRQVEKTLLTYKSRYTQAKLKRDVALTGATKLTTEEKAVIDKYEMALSEKQGIDMELMNRRGGK